MRMFSRGIALLLCIVMVLGMLPTTIFAADEANVPAVAAEEVIDHSIPIYENPQYSFAERAADLVARMTLSQKGSQLISSPAPAISASALGGGALNTVATKDLPQYYWWNEGLHGYNRIDNGASVRGGGAGPANSVSYPQSLTVGSTWNPELYYQEALQVSDEIRERTSRNTQTSNAIDLNFYSPTVNLQRDPRWGRNEESYSEDPYLTTKMGSQYVLGLEGKNQDGTMIDPDGYYKVHSTIKHYVANNSENNRLNGGATTDMDALRNYYLAPYREIIAATDVTSVMTAYSTLNGEPCSFSSYLMDTLLRQTYGLSGYITSDCDSVGTMSRHNYVNPHTGAVLTNDERLAGALAHGEDLECNGGYRGTGSYSANATSMVNGNIQTDAGLVTENTFDIALHRLLTGRIATGEFDENLALTNAAMARIEEQKAAKPDSGVPNQTDERLAIVDAVNNEGVVLLQNKDNFLPLSIPASGEYKVVIVGAWQTNMYFGLYSASSSNSENHIHIQKGITDAIKAKNPDATFTYITSDSVSSSNQAAIEAADVCFVVGGANNSYSAEDKDRSSTALNNNQASMFKQVGQWNPNTVAVMETCGPTQVSTFENEVKAILWSSFGGHHKGVGFGNIITGVVNPSGKVTATWYTSDSELPNINDYNMYATNGSKGRTYMYYTGDAQYPFGYGLSYTTFEYSNLVIDKTEYDANDTVKVSFDVTNTGSVAGKEVTQLYIAQPEAPAELNRPIRQLKGFEKIELQPGETKKVEMEVAIPDLAFYNGEADCFKVDTGAYQVQVGKDSASANLIADFTVSGEMDVYPEVLTVKPNAVGDSEKGIEQRLIYAKGDIINPQLTVAMNDESLYGYIIYDQRSPIKSYDSCDLPEGMTFTYESNRPGVVAVDGDEIKAVGAGVATVTVTGELDGVVVSNEFVVYVESNAMIDGITVDGAPLKGFDREVFGYEIVAEADAKIPVIAATGSSELEITVEQATSIPGIAVITSKEIGSGLTETYRVGIGYGPTTVNFTEGWDAAQAKGLQAQGANENATFGEAGLTIVGEAGMANNFYYEAAYGNWAAQTNVILASGLNAANQQVGLMVKDTDRAYIKLVYERVSSGSSWRPTTNYYVTAYAVNGSESTQVARTGNLGSLNAVSLRVFKNGSSYTFAYSADGGATWAEMDGTAELGMAEPKLGVFNGNAAGATASFDAIAVGKLTDFYPQLASLTVDGVAVDGFDPNTYVYNVEIADDAENIPVLAAVAADETHEVTYEQLDTVTGTAKVNVASSAGLGVYTVSFNYGPSDDYFADGSISDKWVIEKELADEYQVVKGEGLKLYTQAEDYYQDGTNWHNAFTMPAQGTWRAVAKVHFPTSALEEYQQLTMSVWEDEDNYIRICCQESRLLIEPGQEVNGTMVLDGFKTANAVAAEDGTVTVYFAINKIGEEYTISYSQDGVTFTDLGKATANYADPKIVLTGGQNSDSESVWLNFEYLAITSRDGVDANSDYLTWACQNVADYVAADIPAELSESFEISDLPHGYNLTIASSNAAVSADGTVLPGATDKEVQLTITVDDGQASATATKTVTVLGDGGDCDHEYAAVVTAPTCEEDGYTTNTCSKCGAEVVATIVPALGHDWDEGVVTKEPTATRDGVLTYTCANCGGTYTEAIPATGRISMADIDFTDAASANRFNVVNQEATAIREGEGLYLITTKDAFESSGGQISTFNPKDVVEIPVKGDWTATMKFDFSTGSARNGYYQFFGFYAAEGDDYQNMAGIRGGDGAIQNFLCLDGSVTADTDGVKSTPGLASNGTYWWRIEKIDTTYICYRSADGEEFTEMFRYEDTGIAANKIIIDAYTGMTTGYEFIVDSIDFEVPKMADIDFTNPADATRFEIVNQSACEGIVEGVGLTLVSTKNAFETAGDQLKTEAELTPNDVLVIPVEGDWTATLNFDFAENGSRGWYEFFGFYAASGEGYDNLAGIRGADGNVQDFMVVDGEKLRTGENGVAINGSGLKIATEHWFKIIKADDTYTCSWSIDGETYTDLWVMEGTGIEADKIIIDAYAGMQVGYTYTLKSLSFADIKACEHTYEAVVTEATCTEAGYTTYTCSKCGDTYVDDEVPALGHDYVEGVCSVCGETINLDALEIPGAEAIRGNVTLVEEFDGAKITWTSSNPDVITDQAADGKAAGVVTRGEADQRVTLTATVGEVSKAIDVIVKAAPAEITEDDYVGYLFAHFIGEGNANQEQIYFAASEDGRNFTDLNDRQPVITSTVGEKGLRDPYMYRSPEGDRFFIVATDLSIYHRGGWKKNEQGYYDPSTTGSHYLVVYESTDLVNWGEPKHIKVAPENAGMAWAPEMIYHEESGQYIIFFASSIMNPETKYKAKPNAIYYVATRDFVNFSETKLLIDNQTDGVAEGGTPREIIDTTIIKIGDWYYSASKDGDNAEANGGIRIMKTQNLLDYTSWVKVYDLDELNLDLTGLTGLRNGRIDNSTLEGPEFFRFNKKDWADPNVPEYGLFADQYAAGAGYLPIITTDIEDADNSENSWTILRPGEYSFDQLKKRHGTIINLTQAELNRVRGVEEECEHAYEAVVTDPTCVDAGYTTYTCSKCGDSYTADEVAALGHDYKDGVCTVCGAADPNYVPVEPAEGAYVLADGIEAGKTYVLVADGQYALNNTNVTYGSYGSGTDTLGSTPVTVNGDKIVGEVDESLLWTIELGEGVPEAPIYDEVQYFVYDSNGQQLMRRSGSTGTAPLQAGGTYSRIHYVTISFYERADGSYTVFFNTDRSDDYPFTFTATADGVNAPGVAQSNWDPETYGSSFKLYEFVEGTGGGEEECEHAYEAAVTEPTCTEAGYTTYTCSKCGDSYVADEVEALGHDYEAVVTAPTCVDAGYTTYTCSKCGDTYVADEVPATGEHTFENGFCSVCGEVDPEAGIDETLAQAVKAAKEAQAAAEAAKAAAEAAAAEVAVNKEAAEKAAKAAEEAQKAAEEAQAAAEAGDAAAAEKAAAAAESAADAAKAQAAAQSAQAAAEAAQKAAEEAQAKADEAAENSELSAEEAKKAQDAADAAKAKAEAAQKAAEEAAEAADESNVAAAKAAAAAAASAKEAADAQKEIAELRAQVLADKEAIEELLKLAQAAELNVAKLAAKMELKYAADDLEDVEEAVDAGIAAIDAAENVAAVEAALDVALKSLECPSAIFTDAPAKDHWAHEGVDYAVANGLMKGVSEDKFAPEGTLTRAQLVTILYRMAGEPEAAYKGTFADVADEQWYTAAIEWAAANDIVKGVGDGTNFDPNGIISREQIATILYRYSGEPEVEGDLSAYPDAASVSEYALNAMIWAVEEGIITGVASGEVTTLAPKASATREQIASIIMRFIEG